MQDDHCSQYIQIQHNTYIIRSENLYWLSVKANSLKKSKPPPKNQVNPQKTKANSQKIKTSQLTATISPNFSLQSHFLEVLLELIWSKSWLLHDMSVKIRQQIVNFFNILLMTIFSLEYWLDLTMVTVVWRVGWVSN